MQVQDHTGAVIGTCHDYTLAQSRNYVVGRPRREGEPERVTVEQYGLMHHTNLTASVPSNSSARTPPAQPLAFVSTQRSVPIIVTSWPRRQSIAFCAPVLAASSFSSSTSCCSGSSVSRRVSRRR